MRAGRGPARAVSGGTWSPTQFEGGGGTRYDVANEGAGYGNVSPKRPTARRVVEALDDVSARIAEGEIEIPRE